MSSFARISCDGDSKASRDPDPLDRGERPTGPGARFDRRVLGVQIPEVLHELPGERPIARAGLRHPEGARLPEATVEIDDRAREQFGEHRMHVRAGDEMTVGTDGWPLEEASGTREREVHVLGERDRAVVPDRGRDGLARIHGREGT